MTLSSKKQTKSDLPNILLLILLYCIQGVPLGLVFGSIPFLLQKNAISYTQLGIFSLCSYPYSLKLLWSPIVDTYYVKQIGKRKSWIIPMQFAVGILLVIFSFYTQVLIEQHEHMMLLTMLFFVVVLLSATQDIAVDGWALTMLQAENRSYASTCQTIGMSCGFFASYTVFLALNSAEFCSRYLNSEQGILSLEMYTRVWGILFIIVTVLLFFKHEEDDSEVEKSATQVYKELWSIVKLPNMKLYMALLICAKLGFAAADAITPMKLVEKGFRKDNLAMIAAIAFPFEFVFAIVAGKLGSKRPLDLYMVGYKIRMVIACIGIGLVYWFPTEYANKDLPTPFYVFVVLSSLCYSLSSNFMIVAQGSFFAQIADASIGGTYITLLNTFQNLSGTIAKPIAFFVTDWLTIKNDQGSITTDGYYYTSTVCLLLCVAFVMFGSKYLNQLQVTLPQSWKIKP